MKHLNKYIFESSIKSELLNIDLTGIPNRKVVPGSDDAFKLANEQELFVIDKLSKNNSDKEFTHNNENTKGNLTNGDIICKSNGKNIAFIDVKVANIDSQNDLLGTIDINSILNFANNENTWYICVNNDGTKTNIVSGEQAYKVFVNNDCLYKTARTDRDKYLNKEIQQYASKVIKEPIKSDKDKLTWVKCTSDNVSLYDFIPSTIMFPKERKQLDVEATII